MKNVQIPILVLVFIFGLVSTSCSISTQTLKTPNYQMEFYNSDFKYSPEVSAEVSVVRILGINWKKLFNREGGKRKDDPIVSGLNPITPVLGDSGLGRTSSYALYCLMYENPGYDVVVQPKYKTKRFIIPLIYSKRTVKVSARLGQIK